MIVSYLKLNVYEFLSFVSKEFVLGFSSEKFIPIEILRDEEMI